MTLSDRERKIILFGGGGLALFLLIYLVLPALFSGGPTTTGAVTSKKDLESIMRLYRDFSNVQSSFTRIENQINTQGVFSILTELENLASQSEIKSNIESMESKPKPKNEYFTEQAVEVKLIKVTLKQLLTFLYSIEFSPKVLHVKKLHLEVRFDNKELLNAQIEVSTFTPLES